MAVTGLAPTAPPWPSQQRCPSDRHAAMARMQQRREQRSSFGNEDLSYSSKGFEEDSKSRRPRSRHTEVLEDARRYNDDMETKPRREKPCRNVERRRMTDDFDEEPPLRSSRRYREEPEMPQKRDKERDRDFDRERDVDRDRRQKERDRDLDRDGDVDRDRRQKERDRDLDRDVDRDRRHEKSSRKKSSNQEADDEPLPPEVAKADFATLQQMIARQIKEAENQTELPELKPFPDTEAEERRLREERRKKREEEEQQRIAERKRQRQEREEARLREMQELQRQEEEEEERKKEAERMKKAEEELQVRKNKAATKIQAVQRGKFSRANKQFSAKPSQEEKKGHDKRKECTGKKTPDEDLLM